MEIEYGAVQETDVEFTYFLHRAIGFSLVSDVGRDRVRCSPWSSGKFEFEVVEEHSR